MNPIEYSKQRTVKVDELVSLIKAKQCSVEEAAASLAVWELKAAEDGCPVGPGRFVIHGSRSHEELLKDCKVEFTSRRL